MRRIPVCFNYRPAAGRILGIRILLAIVFFRAKVRTLVAERQGHIFLLAMAVLIFGLRPAGAVQGEGTTQGGLRERTVDFRYTFKLTDVPEDAKSIKVWIPLPQDSDAQTISSVQVDGGGGFQIVADPEYGNQFAYLELGTEAGDTAITVTYRVTRYARADLAAKKAGRSLSEELRRKFLSPSRLISVEGAVAAEARMIAGDAKEPLEIARNLYEHIVDTMRYDKSGEGWGLGDSMYACDVRTGNCTDFHSLFIGEARSLGLPARFIMGFPLPDDAEAGTIWGYHCWAEFYTPEYGWVPIDASDAFKHPERRDFLFGGLDENRVKFTSGRDIQLPGMEGAPLNFSIYPYAEIDGKMHTSIETEYFFENVD